LLSYYESTLTLGVLFSELMRRSLHLLYIFSPARGTDRFLSRAFVDVAASGTPVLVPFQFIHIKIRGTANGTHAASPHIPSSRYDQKNIVLPA